MSMNAWLRIVGLIEAISYILLVAIAMPLKYGMGIDMAVSIVGAAHGALWILYVLLIALAWYKATISFGFSAALVGLSLIPFGPLLVDHHLKDEADADPGSTAEEADSDQ